jgi:TolA-binding protein
MTGNDRQCPDDLVVRAQRRQLSEIERRVLDAHLAQCEACRAASALGALFGAIPDAQPGDDQLIARVKNRAVRTQRWLRGAGLRAAAIVALLVLTSGAAVGAWLSHRAAQPRSDEALTQDRRSVPSSARSHVSPPRSAPTEIPVVPEPSAEASDEPTQPAETERKRRPAQRGADPGPSSTIAPTMAEATPGAVFAQANALRRTGDVRKAIALYQSLRQRFPDSEEARLSALSQGDLLLGEGEPANAVAAYGAYLRAVPHGALTEEALFGKARGLGQLGQSGEERRTWEELVRRFPRSAYHPAALRRLKELSP